MVKGQASETIEVTELQDLTSNLERLKAVIQEALEQQLADITSKLSEEVVRFSKEVSRARDGSPSQRPKVGFEPSGMRNRKRPAMLQAPEEDVQTCPRRLHKHAHTLSGPLEQPLSPPPDIHGQSFPWAKRAYKTKSYAELEDRFKLGSGQLTWIGTPRWQSRSKKTFSPPSASPKKDKQAKTQNSTGDVKTGDAWEHIPESAQSSPDRSPPRHNEERNLVLKVNSRSMAHSKLRQSADDTISTTCTVFDNSYSMNSYASSVPADAFIELRHLDSSFTLPDKVFQRPLARLVTSEFFDYFAGLIVFLSTVYIGAKSNFLLREHIWFQMEFKVLDLIFCAFFTIELSLRVFVFRSLFFTINGWEWNVLDLVLTIYQVFQEILEAILYANRNELNRFWIVHRPTPYAMYFRFLRFLRILKLIRVPRLRRYITEFRVMASSVLHSLRYLLWACVILWFFIYVFAVHISLMVGRHGVIYPLDLDEGTVLYERWGTLPRAMFSLFQAITAGEDWYVLFSALTEISIFSSLVFCFYICFTYLYIMNIITGVFVEVAMTEAQEISECNMVSELHDLFHMNDMDDDGSLSWSEFQRYLSSPAMKRTFDAIDLDVQEAENLFTLLDMDQTGNISYDEFVTGCLRLRGGAKSIDVATLMYESRRTRSAVHATNRLLMRISEALDIELSNGVISNVVSPVSPDGRSASFLHPHSPETLPQTPLPPISPIAPVLT